MANLSFSILNHSGGSYTDKLIVITEFFLFMSYLYKASTSLYNIPLFILIVISVISLCTQAPRVHWLSQAVSTRADLTITSVMSALYSYFLVRDGVSWCSHVQIWSFQSGIAFTLVITAVVGHHVSQSPFWKQLLSTDPPFHRSSFSLFFILPPHHALSSQLLLGFHSLCKLDRTHSWWTLPALPYRPSYCRHPGSSESRVTSAALKSGAYSQK